MANRLSDWVSYQRGGRALLTGVARYIKGKRKIFSVLYKTFKSKI